MPSIQESFFGPTEHSGILVLISFFTDLICLCRCLLFLCDFTTAFFFNSFRVISEEFGDEINACFQLSFFLFLRLNPSFSLMFESNYLCLYWLPVGLFWLLLYLQIVFHHHWSEYNCVRWCLHQVDIGYVNGACLWVDHEVLVLPVDCPQVDPFLSHMLNKVWVVEWITIFD